METHRWCSGRERMAWSSDSKAHRAYTQNSKPQFELLNQKFWFKLVVFLESRSATVWFDEHFQMFVNWNLFISEESVSERGLWRDSESDSGSDPQSSWQREWSSKRSGHHGMFSEYGWSVTAVVIGFDYCFTECSVTELKSEPNCAESGRPNCAFRKD